MASPFDRAPSRPISFDLSRWHLTPHPKRTLTVETGYESDLSSAEPSSTVQESFLCERALPVPILDPHAPAIFNADSPAQDVYELFALSGRILE
ncbi:hypothetical protein ColLi_01900 [Colletotrichum liriopes]|uniref:Uncharacterized protein n=1 Tax=Colletotrichum liriopes TaxID=708192 RepID=A0AA37LPC4_9PEZI|nr:hypothetical protein ColLi_01900 [Colletotrichum liriopes]